MCFKGKPAPPDPLSICVLLHLCVRDGPLPQNFGFSNLCGTVYKSGNVVFTPDGNSLLSPVGNRITVFDLIECVLRAARLCCIFLRHGAEVVRGVMGSMAAVTGGGGAVEVGAKLCCVVPCLAGAGTPP
jgi:hypothetical protein